jgi:surface antigen
MYSSERDANPSEEVSPAMEHTITLRRPSFPTRSAAFKAVAVVLLVVTLFGCATVGDNPKAAVGGFGGAALGGLIAAAAGGGGAAIAAGVIGGALLGGFAGSMLDDRDKRLAAESAHKALESTPSGKSVAWTNPDTGHTGSVTPTRTYQQPNGAYCREYQQTVTIGGKQEQSYGTACRQPDGNWKTVN